MAKLKCSYFKVGSAVLALILVSLGCDINLAASPAPHPSTTPSSTPSNPPATPSPSASPAPTAPPMPTPGTTASKWVSGYYVPYTAAGNPSYPPSAIDYAAMTHIVVGYVTPNSDGTINDQTGGLSVNKEIATRAAAAGTKVILMIGGANSNGAGQFASAASSANVAKFAQNLINFANTNFPAGYAGFDLDTEPFGTTADLAGFKLLVQKLKSINSTYVLTVPTTVYNVNYHPDFDTVAQFYASMSSSLDQINMMSYAGIMEDPNPSDGWKSWHASPLYGVSAKNPDQVVATTPESVANSIDAFVAQGVPRAKLGIGIGFYGICYRGGITGPGQTLNNAGTADDNVMSYYNIMTHYFSLMKYTYDSGTESPYLSSSSGMGSENCTFVSYEDPTSIAAKGAYVKATGLGGTIIWTINEGYLPNTGSPISLLEAVKAAFF